MQQFYERIPPMVKSALSLVVALLAFAVTFYTIYLDAQHGNWLCAYGLPAYFQLAIGKIAIDTVFATAELARASNQE